MDVAATLASLAALGAWLGTLTRAITRTIRPDRRAHLSGNVRWARREDDNA